VRAVIFDMDGLLVDSEPLWVRAEIEVFGEVGVALDPAACARTKGLRVDDVVRHWHAARAWASPTVTEVEARLVSRVAALVTAEGVALPGARHALEVARANGRRVGLASSSPRAIIDATLARLRLDGAFDVVVSAEAELLGKPHPAVFLSAAARLGAEPVACVVLEDSLTGVIAAKAARMRCVAVPEARGSHDARFILADEVLATLDDLEEAHLVGRG
jgi:mannitol-1-/sugar-/sorbitol-6-/2-deoxyglucose-6-phosphatase